MGRNTLFLIVILWFGSWASACAQEVFGKWNTVDDKTHEIRSIVEIYPINGRAFGKVVAITDPERQEDICTACDDDDPRKNQPILGMVIMKGLKKAGNTWTGGEVLDPETGKIYKCKMWIDNGSLVIRGYLGFTWLGRSQTWIRASE